MKYDLVGINGNAFCIMAYVWKAMRECRFSKDECQAYYNEATSGDYDHLLCASISMIDKCNEIADKALYAKI
jgi:hypothetical protein